MPRDSPNSRVLIALPRLAVNSRLFRIFGDLTAAQRAEMDDGVGVGREHRAAALDHVVLAADHDQKTSLHDGRRSTAHRGVDHRNTLLGSRLGDLASRCRDARCCGWR